MCPISELKTDKLKNNLNQAAGRTHNTKEINSPVMDKPKKLKNRSKRQAKHILLVEDEIDVSIVTKTRLELEGYKVSAVNDGMEALNFIEKERPDLMLLDLKMPRLDGFSVYKRLKSNDATKGIPVILFSGSSDYMLDLERKCLEFGVDDLIRKPYETNTLLKIITKLIRKKLPGKNQELISGRLLVKRF